LIPETKGRSLEEMDIIFGAVSAEERQEYITKREKGTVFALFSLMLTGPCSLRRMLEFAHVDENNSSPSHSIDRKV
jgi:hypothetical protein